MSEPVCIACGGQGTETHYSGISGAIQHYDCSACGGSGKAPAAAPAPPAEAQPVAHVARCPQSESGAHFCGYCDSSVAPCAAPVGEPDAGLLEEAVEMLLHVAASDDGDEGYSPARADECRRLAARLRKGGK